MMQKIKFKLFFLIFILSTVTVFSNQNIIVDNLLLNKNLYIYGDTSKTAIDYYQKGKVDAKKYYHHSGPFTSCFLTGLLAPPVGLISTTIVSVTKPEIYNLGIPFEKKDLLLNKTYMDGYLKTAKKRKALLSWAGYFTGTAFLAGALVMTGYTPDYFFRK